MKTLLTICALAAGAGLTATANTAEAGHCHRSYGGHGRYGGSYYSSPSYGYSPSYGHRYIAPHHHHGHVGRHYDRGYGYGGRGYGGYGYRGRSGFSLQTRGFGIYVR